MQIPLRPRLNKEKMTSMSFFLNAAHRLSLSSAHTTEASRIKMRSDSSVRHFLCLAKEKMTSVSFFLNAAHRQSLSSAHATEASRIKMRSDSSVRHFLCLAKEKMTSVSSGFRHCEEPATRLFGAKRRNGELVRHHLKTFSKAVVISALMLVFGQAEAKQLTFTDAKTMALKNSNIIKAYKAQEEAAGYQKLQAKGAYLPNVALHQTIMKSDEPGTAAFSMAKQGRFDMPYFMSKMANPDYVTNYTTSLIVMQPVFMQGQIYFGIKQAENAYDASRMETERVTQHTLYNLHMAFYGLALAEKAKEVVSHSYERTQRYQKTAKDFYNNGLIVKSDLMVSESHLLMNEQALKEAEKQHAVAMSQLQRLLDTDDDIQVVWSSPDLEFSSDQTKYMTAALTKRQDLQAMQNYMKVTDYEAMKAKSAFLPSVYLFADHQMNDEELLGDSGKGTTYCLQADITLFKGFGGVNKVKEAKSRQISMIHKIADKKLEIKSEVKNAYYGVITASKQIEASRKRVEAAQTALTITENRFNEGLAKVTELLDREVDLKEAELSLYMSEYQLIIEKAGLHLAAGDLK